MTEPNLKPMSEPIPVDEQAILALQRVTTGAYIHDTNELISWYKNACHIAQGTIQY